MNEPEKEFIADAYIEMVNHVVYLSGVIDQNSRLVKRLERENEELKKAALRPRWYNKILRIWEQR